MGNDNEFMSVMKSKGHEVHKCNSLKEFNRKRDIFIIDDDNIDFLDKQDVIEFTKSKDIYFIGLKDTKAVMDKFFSRKSFDELKDENKFLFIKLYNENDELSFLIQTYGDYNSLDQIISKPLL